MPRTLAKAYGDLQSRKCREHRCTVQLNRLVSYCGESIRNKVFGNTGLQIEMCDCIIANNTETKISLVELKDRTSDTTKISYRLVDKARSQFCGGLTVLREILKEVEKSEICLQLVLFTKVTLNRSERERLREPLPGVSNKITIVNRMCGCNLPDSYQRISVSNWHNGLCD